VWERGGVIDNLDAHSVERERNQGALDVDGPGTEVPTSEAEFEVYLARGYATGGP